MSLSSHLTPSLQDFSLIRSRVERKQQDYGFQDSSNAFYFVAMDLILGLQEDEIKDSITDSNFLRVFGQSSGHDRGIDAVYIDNLDTTATIHLFNFKYAETFKKSKNNFPSNEIDKIVGLINSIVQQDENLADEVNAVLFSKIKEIWKIFESQNPHFVLHLCSNYYQNLEPQEKARLERSIGRFSNYDIKYHLMPDFVKYVTSQGKKIVNARIRAIDQRYFEKSDGNIRALVVNVDAKDLIRIVLDDEEIRDRVDFDDNEYEVLKNIKILEDAFEDNVRTYQKKSPINRNIKNTALSDENNKFFYYNNGITLTCDSFEYSQRRSPVVKLKNMQVVNGSQTIHSLYEAFLEDANKFENIEILCRICETKDSTMSTRIAEYTNSQNPVKSRDIRSVDFIQQKLEKELVSRNKFYERKRNQYADKPKSQRIDAEKAGQVLMAFYNKSPYESKNRKGLIFGDKYEEVFNEEITANKLLLAYELFEKVETQKDIVKSQIVSNVEMFEEKSYIIHASYYILYVLGELARKLSIDLQYENIDAIWDLYPKAVEAIERTISKEKELLAKQYSHTVYSHAVFFRSNKSKKYFEDLEETELGELLALE